MNRRAALLALGSGLVLARAAAAGDRAAIDPSRLADHVRTLASDAFQGRAPGGPGEGPTLGYIIRELKAAGLRPAGDRGPGGDRLWTQAVRMARYALAATPEVTITAAGTPVPWASGQDFAVRAPRIPRSRLRLADRPVVFAGYGVSAPERQWDDFKDVDLAGKVMVVLVNDPDFEGGEGDFGGRAMTYYGRWSYKFEEAARRGAAAVLIIHEDAPAAYGWATVRASIAAEVFDLAGEAASEDLPLEGWISRDAGRALMVAAGLDFGALKAAARTRAFRPVELQGVTLSADVSVRRDTIVSHNVAALLRGERRPGDTLIFSAHWDHLGVGPPDARGDRIYNGALDNATGVATLLELARVLRAGPPPERSLMFLFLTAEERGLLGAEAYVRHPLAPLERTVAAINVDTLRPDGPSRDFTTMGESDTSLFEDLRKAGDTVGRAFSHDPRPEAGSFFRSDHFPFAKAGVPALSLGSGLDLIQGGLPAGQAWGLAYMGRQYHQPSDEFDPAWSFDSIAADVELLRGLAMRLGNGDNWPTWGPTSEFQRRHPPRGVRGRK